MYQKISILFLILICLIFSSCLVNPGVDEPFIHNYAIRVGVRNVPLFDMRVFSIEIEKIIEEEIGKNHFGIFTTFETKWITIYRLYDMFVNAQDNLLTQINEFSKKSLQYHIKVSSHVDFLPESALPRLKGMQDLVVYIEDPEKKLYTLKQHIKDSIAVAYDHYKDQYNETMYDRVKSEQHDYALHVWLGYLHVDRIKKLFNDGNQAKIVLERIKQRIIQKTSALLSELPQEQKQLLLTKISLYDYTNRKSIPGSNNPIIRLIDYAWDGVLKIIF